MEEAFNFQDEYFELDMGFNSCCKFIVILDFDLDIVNLVSRSFSIHFNQLFNYIKQHSIVHHPMDLLLMMNYHYYLYFQG